MLIRKALLLPSRGYFMLLEMMSTFRPYATRVRLLTFLASRHDSEVWEHYRCSRYFLHVQIRFSLNNSPATGEEDTNQPRPHPHHLLSGPVQNN